MIIQPIVDIPEICYLKGVQYAVISPGSRSAHLTISFARHPGIKKIIVPDERSAAYIALGIAQQSRSTVALICTSGTAAVNFYPAITEAYYQNVPLLILTADRPAEWIDKNDGQTIRQNNLYQNHIKKSYAFPESFENEEVRKLSVFTVNDAINQASHAPQGPVHVNVPIREPFYPLQNERIEYSKELSIIDQSQVSKDDHLHSDALINSLSGKNVVLVAGQKEHNKKTTDWLDKLNTIRKIPVFSDIISNTSQASSTLTCHDSFIHPELPKPDILITFGRSIISKKLKLFLRNNKKLEHWHISDNDYPADTFLSLTKIINCSVNIFLEKLFDSQIKGDEEFYDPYEKANNTAKEALQGFWEKADFGEFKAVKLLFDRLPENCVLHLANSMPVRYANIVNTNKNIEVFANRGASGIDGCLSTAVGHSLVTGKLNIILTGDMAFFYDRNALWHNYPLANLRIVILNNHGGGIFRLIEGPSSQPELDDYFETHQKLNAKNTASDFGMDYYLCTSEKDLEEIWISFFEPSENGKILEIETDKIINQKVFSNYKKLIEHGT